MGGIKEVMFSQSVVKGRFLQRGSAPAERASRKGRHCREGTP